jgi:glycosyltransferase involved in cell wall biosynthesis
VSRISVVLPNYNHAAFLEESLPAILAQSHPPHEVIVVDDASTDDSVAVVQRFAGQDSRVRLVRNASNRGTNDTVNEGFKVISGDYVYLAAADDLALPGLFERAARLLDEHPEAGLCCGDPEYVDVSSGRRTRQHLGLSAGAAYIPPATFTEHVRRHGAHLPGVSALVRRSALDAAGRYVDGLKWKADWFLLLVIAFRHGVCYVPEPLGAARVRPGSYSDMAGHPAAEQRQLVRRLIDVLRSPSFRDVKGPFRRSGVLASLPFAGTTVLQRPQYWSELSLQLARRSLWPAFMWRMARVSPLWIKRVYRQVLVRAS